jgi:hypothetical protein
MWLDLDLTNHKQWEMGSHYLNFGLKSNVDVEWVNSSEEKTQKQMIACNGDTLPVLLVWFPHNLAGLSNSNNDFRFFYKCHRTYYSGL